VERHTYAVAPPRVEYRLTGIARHLRAALDSLCGWSEAYGPEAALARSRYDRQPKHPVSARSVPPLPETFGENVKKLAVRKVSAAGSAQSLR
jgi:hypothetical protein